MAIVREYKRGKRKNVSKKVRDAAGSMSDKEVTDFMKKGAPLIDINKILGGLADTHISDIPKHLRKTYSLPDIPTGGYVESAIRKYHGIGAGDPTTSVGKAVFSDDDTFQEALKEVYRGNEANAAMDVLGVGKRRDALRQLLDHIQANRLSKEGQAQEIIEGVPNTDLYGASAGLGLAGLGSGAMVQGNRIIKGIDKW